ncbi:MAG TPA: sigma 54-interacting transcriptional regulator, partial [Bacillota bacterium]|nr:sigma 54-interacting transcriptional regulator [Bacillota bacterium]
MTLLQKDQAFVQSIAEAISAAVALEVEIVDNSHFVVAGTGVLRNDVGVTQQRGHICRHVLSIKKPFFLEKPGEHWICQQCVFYKNCFHKVAMFSPILLEDEAIGLISLNSFNDDQTEKISSNVESFTNYLNKMSALLASRCAELKLIEERELTRKQVEAMINTVREGIIAVNNEGKITYVNSSAAKILRLNTGLIKDKPIQEILPSSHLIDVLKIGVEITSREVVHKRGNNNVTVLSSAYPIKNGSKIIGAVESFNLTEDVHKMASHLSMSQKTNFNDILGNSTILREVKQRAQKVAEGSSTVLITGESGTGKELFARAIHHASPRADKPFISINCSAIPEPLLESELFGYEGGAFTGAKHAGKPGKFELADSGTIFLDEIGDMPLYMQSKLLRVLQEKKIERVGGIKSISIDVRVIAATNKDLHLSIRQGEFRSDLFYRLNVIPLHIPPLRERKDDIPCLMEFFLQKYNKILHKEFTGFTKKAKNILLNYSYPGNVRELENI